MHVELATHGMHTARLIPVIASETCQKPYECGPKIKPSKKSALLDNIVKSVTKLLREAVSYFYAAKDLVYF